MRPWEWGAIEAESWTEAVQLRNAWHEGQHDARDEAAMDKRLREMNPETAA